MKKNITKMTALCLCALLTVSGSAMNAFALNSDGNETKEQEETQTVADADDADVSANETESDASASADETESDADVSANETESDAGVSADETESTADDADVSKDETVYILAGADGSAQKIIVSDWIKNVPGRAEVKDRSELTEVENVKGEETYTMSDDNMLVWDAQGNDIYYQGSIEKELPVDLSVTYKLDGEPISAEDLAGKSGRVTIRFEYQNKQYETVDIDGENEKIYVPFAMLTGVLLDDDVFTNVDVTNGKVIDDGSRTAVMGIAFPGLQEDLAISKDKLEIPDYVEITADVSNFQLAMTATLATNELFGELDVDSFDPVSDLSDSMEDLTDAMDQLLDGSSQLYDGLAALLEKSGDLTEGIGQLAAGAETLKTGSESLDAGAAELQSGAAELSSGLSTLTSNNDTLNGGAKQVFDTLLSTADTQLAAAGLDVSALTVENYAQVLDNIIASMEANADQQAQSASAAEGAQTIIALKGSLDSYNEFYLGLQSYTAGVADAAAGAGTLKDGTDDLKTGTSQLSTGASELYDGIITLKDGTPDLVDGITQLYDGAAQLSEGLQDFNEEGIQKLVDAVDGDLNGLVTRLRAARDVSLRYKNFAGAEEDMDGQVKFIYRTDAIE